MAERKARRWPKERLGGVQREVPKERLGGGLSCPKRGAEREARRRPNERLGGDRKRG